MPTPLLGQMMDVPLNVSTLLAQISRRVRSGELEVQGSKQMSAESALVAALGALLAESAKKQS